MSSNLNGGSKLVHIRNKSVSTCEALWVHDY